MDITEYFSTAEAAEYSGYSIDHVSYLCKRGKLTGAMCKSGKWFIPRISMMMYGRKKSKSNE